MYAAGGIAGALFGALVLWIVLPAQAVNNPETAMASPAPAMAPPAVEPEHQHPTEFTRISVDELKAKFDRNEVTLIDVRDMQSYLAAHIPGALHIPVSLIEGEVSYLPKDKPIVTYCTCPAEESSGQAAQILEHAGIRGVAALHGGFQEWVARGYASKSGKE